LNVVHFLLNYDLVFQKVRNMLIRLVRTRIIVGKKHQVSIVFLHLFATFTALLLANLPWIISGPFSPNYDSVGTVAGIFWLIIIFPIDILLIGLILQWTGSVCIILGGVLPYLLYVRLGRIPIWTPFVSGMVCGFAYWLQVKILFAMPEHNNVDWWLHDPADKRYFLISTLSLVFTFLAVWFCMHHSKPDVLGTQSES